MIVNNIIQGLSKRLSVSEIQAMHRVIQFVIVLSLVLNTLAGIALYVIMHAFSCTREVGGLSVVYRFEPALVCRSKGPMLNA